MHILLTNDDGYSANGLVALYQALAAKHEVTVVAPEVEQSAIGHAITVSEPIKVRPLTTENAAFNGYAVRGTPADCVKLACCELLNAPPDLVVSGINHGANVGVNILYSGTVSAASDAAIMGLPALAFSQEFAQNMDFSAAAEYAAKLVDAFFSLGVPTGVLLNVNVPSRPKNQIKGMRLVYQSGARLNESFERRQDPRGRIYYWQLGETMRATGNIEDDHQSLSDGYITITPIRHDLTHYQELDRLKNKNQLLPVFP